MKYLLDTDITSEIIRGNPQLLKKAQLHLESWAISAITAAELSVWLFGKNRPELEIRITEFLEDCEIMPFRSQAAIEFGRLQQQAANKKFEISAMDALIAAHALSLNLTLVTNNVKHFEKVPDLQIENWSK